jgi:DNA-binding NarL/FixJ family response regulator
MVKLESPAGRERPGKEKERTSADHLRTVTADDDRAGILIVEDDYFVATDLEQALVDAGFTVVGIAATAEQALALAKATRPEIAVMDIRLAGVRDGIEAAVDLLSNFGIRSIFATAQGNEATRNRAAKARPLGWLTKPYSTQVAIAVIRTFVHSATEGPHSAG